MESIYVTISAKELLIKAESLNLPIILRQVLYITLRFKILSLCSANTFQSYQTSNLMNSQ